MNHSIEYNKQSQADASHRCFGRYGKGIMIKYLFIITLIFPVCSFASQTEYADIHEIYKSGSLPEPYNSFSVRVVLNEEDHSISEISINVGTQAIFISKDKVAKLKKLDLSSFFVGHEIYRSKSSPYSKLDDGSNDFFVVRLSSSDGVERNHTWYADYYSILVNLDVGDVEISKTERARP